jgi:hypothetical protein
MPVRISIQMQRLRLVSSGSGTSPPAQKTFDAEGEAFEHALTKSFRIQKRGCQKSVLLARPIPVGDDQGRMQKGFPHALRGALENLRSGGESDSELSH